MAEVAALLKVHHMTVRNWIDSGELPAVRVGSRRVRIKRSDFDDFIDRGYSGHPDKQVGAPGGIGTAR